MNMYASLQAQNKHNGGGDNNNGAQLMVSLNNDELIIGVSPKHSQGFINDTSCVCAIYVPYSIPIAVYWDY